jgi:hypothetical protein
VFTQGPPRWQRGGHRGGHPRCHRGGHAVFTRWPRFAARLGGYWRYSGVLGSTQGYSGTLEGTQGYSGVLGDTGGYSDCTELVDDRREDEHHSDDHNHLRYAGQCHPRNGPVPPCRGPEAIALALRKIVPLGARMGGQSHLRRTHGRLRMCMRANEGAGRAGGLRACAKATKPNKQTNTSETSKRPPRTNKKTNKQRNKETKKQRNKETNERTTERTNKTKKQTNKRTKKQTTEQTSKRAEQTNKRASKQRNVACLLGDQIHQLAADLPKTTTRCRGTLWVLYGTPLSGTGSMVLTLWVLCGTLWYSMGTLYCKVLILWYLLYGYPMADGFVCSLLIGGRDAPWSTLEYRGVHVGYLPWTASSACVRRR